MIQKKNNPRIILGSMLNLDLTLLSFIIGTSVSYAIILLQSP